MTWLFSSLSSCSSSFQVQYRSSTDLYFCHEHFFLSFYRKSSKSFFSRYPIIDYILPTFIRQPGNASYMVLQNVWYSSNPITQLLHKGHKRKYGSWPSQRLVRQGNSLFGVSMKSIFTPILSRSWLQVDTPSTPRQLHTVPALRGSSFFILDTFSTTSHNVLASIWNGFWS